MKTSLLSILCAFLLLASCNKDNSNDPPLLPGPDYRALKTGNYWIFEGYQQDSAGAFQPTGDTDSAYISGDTVINGKTYFIRHEKPFILTQTQQVSYLRDSSGYLVDHLGNILMSETNFSDTLKVDTTAPFLYYGYAMMTGNDSLVSVPAGDIPSVTMRLTVIPADTAMHLPTRYAYWVYGENVGKIKTHLFFFAGDQHFEARLVRYHVSQ
ncbi:MAG: hypothetical protein JXA23_05335 [Bacteroidales bacterium]|nr:hypothetical protein [Bacteroidales bacterium]